MGKEEDVDDHFQLKLIKNANHTQRFFTLKKYALNAQTLLMGRKYKQQMLEIVLTVNMSSTGSAAAAAFLDRTRHGKFCTIVLFLYVLL